MPIFVLALLLLIVVASVAALHSLLNIRKYSSVLQGYTWVSNHKYCNVGIRIQRMIDVDSDIRRGLAMFKETDFNPSVGHYVITIVCHRLSRSVEEYKTVLTTFDELGELRYDGKIVLPLKFQNFEIHTITEQE